MIQDPKLCRIYDLIIQTLKSINKLIANDTKKFPETIESMQKDLTGVYLGQDVIIVMEKYIRKANNVC